LSKSTTTGEQTEGDRRAVSKGTPIRLGVNAARDDVKLCLKESRGRLLYFLQSGFQAIFRK